MEKITQILELVDSLSILELKDLVKALSGNNNTPEFNNALALAQERSVDSRADFITLFAGTLKLLHKTLSLNDRIVQFAVCRSDFDTVDAEFKYIHQFRIIRAGICQRQQLCGQAGDECGLDIVGFDQFFIKFVGHIQIGH